MDKTFAVRRASIRDAYRLKTLLFEWLAYEPRTNRLGSIKKAIRNREFLVAESELGIVGFIHYVLHEDVIDGAPNAFITAFYVLPAFRRKGVGSLLLKKAIVDALMRGAVGVETSTTHSSAKKPYEEHHFKQTIGDMGEVFLELDVDEFLQAQ